LGRANGTTARIVLMKNEPVVAKLKSLLLSLMAVQAELRGLERTEMAGAIAHVRKTLELLK